MPGTNSYVHQHEQNCERRGILWQAHEWMGFCETRIEGLPADSTEAQSSAPGSFPLSPYTHLYNSYFVDESYHFGFQGLHFLLTLYLSYLFTRAVIAKCHKLSGLKQQNLSQTLMLMSNSRCQLGHDSSGASFPHWVTYIISLCTVSANFNPCLSSCVNHGDSPSVCLFFL